MNTQELVERIKQIHGDKYDCSKVEFDGNYNKKVKLICPIHDEFEISVKHLLYSKQGCKECVNDAQRIGTEECIKRIKEIHGDKYDCSRVNYKNNKAKIILGCPIHGWFEIVPQSIFRQKARCQKCGYESMKKKHSKPFDEVIKEAKKIHGDDYDYSDAVYVNNKTPIKVKCKRCGCVFYPRPENHIQLKSGCPHCNISKLENQIKQLLNANNIEFIQFKKFDWLRNDINYQLSLDFYLPKYNIAIECQGMQHFEEVKIFGGEERFEIRVKNDKLKYELCKEHGIRLFYFSNLIKYDTFLNEYLYHNEEELLAEIKNCLKE